MLQYEHVAPDLRLPPFLNALSQFVVEIYLFPRWPLGSVPCASFKVPPLHAPNHFFPLFVVRSKDMFNCPIRIPPPSQFRHFPPEFNDSLIKCLIHRPPLPSANYSLRIFLVHCSPIADMLFGWRSHRPEVWRSCTFFFSGRCTPAKYQFPP